MPAHDYRDRQRGRSEAAAPFGLIDLLELDQYPASGASAVPGNLCLGSLTYRNRLSSSASVIPDLRHSHHRGQLLPR
jgi:hypothetical protein